MLFIYAYFYKFFRFTNGVGLSESWKEQCCQKCHTRIGQVLSVTLRYHRLELDGLVDGQISRFYFCGFEAEFLGDDYNPPMEEFL